MPPLLLDFIRTSRAAKSEVGKVRGMEVRPKGTSRQEGLGRPTT